MSKRANRRLRQLERRVTALEQTASSKPLVVGNIAVKPETEVAKLPETLGESLKNIFGK